MLLFKIANKPSSIFNLIDQKYMQCVSHHLKILSFIKNETFSYYLRWFMLFTLIKWHSVKIKINYFISYIMFSFFNKQKLISYVIRIQLSPTNTLININNIKGNPKLFYSAGMFNLRKKQKTKQPKAIITILRTLLLKSKIMKTKPVALHFNNLFPNHQSYIFKKLKQKIFIKLIMLYNYYPHNGCRARKKKRIKIRTRTKKF